jgi:hypothetical protein
MITETNKGSMVAHLASSVEWRYPLEGAYQYDFDKTPMVYRRGEPINKEYPLIEMTFLPRSDAPVRGLGDVIKDYSGALVYGYGELEPIIITVYTHQICEGIQSAYHGKIVADEYIRRIERYIRRYWPKMLQSMEAYIYKPMSFLVNDISEFLQGDEKQGFELTMHIISTNKWDYTTDDYTGVDGGNLPYTGVFTDASISTQGQDEYDNGENPSNYPSVSGYMYDQQWW